jgi:superfamily II DNA or RNA helicase
MPLSEADTSRKFIIPKLQASGWDDDPHSIAEQRSITDGRIVPVGKGFVRKPPKRVDYLLRYERNFPLAVVEAKAAWKTAGDGMQQAKDYAEMLGLKFAYATNGQEIIEFDYFTGKGTLIPTYPRPADLWARYRTGKGLADNTVAVRLTTPMNHTVGKGERYYQEIAINRAVEGILTGRRRQLLTMATGTGKTAVAFQICWKLWNTRWNRTGEYQRPKILYLADRNILIDQPKDGMFASFGDARWKIEGGVVNLGREMYFAIYQSIARDERRPGLYREFPQDFFDLVIVDECHRGSARDDSNWREILTWFEPAYQLGMTATPLREDNRDTYLYFGNPIYEYSLRQGIEDGFLAPYRIHRVITEWDAAGWRPSKDELDRYGRAIPDEEYQTKDFERVVALLARTEAIAKHLSNFLKKTVRFAKTIVFCVDQEHADVMRRMLNNINIDLVQQYPDYVCRVTSDEGEIGRGHLGRFQDVESLSPVILTTSQLLTTGVDVPTCKNIVLARVVGSVCEFKQIIGRGTGSFLVESYNHLAGQVKTVADRRTLQERSLFGCEPKTLPYLLCQMNLLLHGLDAPRIDPGNALRFKLTDIGEKDRVDVIVTNPPFGGEEEKGIQRNFPDDKQTAETALLFLQLIMRKLRRGSTPAGRPALAAVVVPNGTLFGDGVCARIKEELLKEFNLHTIVRLPNGVFSPYTGIPTNLLFFDRSGPTREIWYYEHPLPEGRKNCTKTQPLRFEEFATCVTWWGKREENDRAWKVPVKTILKYNSEGRLASVNLDIKNPKGKADVAHLPPEQLVESILEKEHRIAEIIGRIKTLLEKPS